jgi:poly-gamma-glutamate capsule biosynthesis protein CapA/YwtB (metallophosphatase superfamily)
LSIAPRLADARPKAPPEGGDTATDANVRARTMANRYLFDLSILWWAHKGSNLGPAD